MLNTDYISVTEFCEKYGKYSANVRKQIHQGRIPAVRIGNQWAIPSDVRPPADARVKSGRYKKESK